MAGYDPKDTKERRVFKACCFCKSMQKKGQDRDVALQIASKYYHVPEDLVREYVEGEENDDIYFMINSAIPIAASDIFDPGDFC